MTKAECEKALRALCHDWRRERCPSAGDDLQFSFSEFKSWLEEKRYSHYLEFRSLRGAEADAEDWFDQELKQTWRN
jgi:hypothetical protein